MLPGGPILTGLSLPRAATPRASIAASPGLVVVLACYLLVHSLGTFDVEWATQIWTVRFELWQEYALLYPLPVFAVAHVWDPIRR